MNKRNFNHDEFILERISHHPDRSDHCVLDPLRHYPQEKGNGSFVVFVNVHPPAHYLSPSHPQ